MGGEIPELGFPCDSSTDVLPVVRNFNVNIRSRSEWQQIGSPRPETDEIFCFTDGSKIGRRTGAAFVVTGPEKIVMSSPLGEYVTVPQAEVLAVLEAARTLAEGHVSQKVKFYVDCMSLLTSLTGTGPVPGLVRECFDALELLARKCDVELNWIPAHKRVLWK
jgi:ribonuclease HI